MSSASATVAVPTRNRLPGRRGITAVVVTLIVIACVLLVRDLAGRIVPVLGGPLHVNVGTVTTVPVRVGESISFGVWPHNTTGEAAVVDRVSLFGPRQGVHVLGVRVLSTVGRGGIGTIRRFPPAPGHPTEPLRATAIADTKAHPTQFLIGLEVTRPGRYEFPGVVVEYHVGSTRYETLILQALVICTSSDGETRPSGCGGTGSVVRRQERIRAFLFPGEG